MIERLKGFPDNVVAIACHGEVTKQDYDTVLIPAVEKALKTHDKLRLLYEVGPTLPVTTLAQRGRISRSAWNTTPAGSGSR